MLPARPSSSNSVIANPNSAKNPSVAARRGLKDITNVTNASAPVAGKPIVKQQSVASGKSKTSTSFFSGTGDAVPDEAIIATSINSSLPMQPADSAQEIEARAPSPSESSIYNRREADDIDARDSSNPLMVTHYVQEIYSHYRQKEISCVSATYMQRQPHINEKMRAILIDWLVGYRMKYHLNKI
jgi:hypothetical protein